MKIINSIRTTLFHTKSLVIGLLLCWLFPNSVWAYDAYVNGIYYDLNTTDRTAEVTSNQPDEPNNYSGAVDIPVSFVYNGSTYSVTSISSYAFALCNSLTSVTIPNSVTSIGEYVFNDCTNLTSLIVSEDNNNYDSRNNCNAIIETATNTLIFGCKNTVIPNSVTGIGNGAFCGSAGLSSMTIPNNVTSIGKGAFANCISLSSMTIPISITSIGNGAFANCTGLLSITAMNETPPSIEINTFSNVDKANCKLIVPVGTKTAYENAQFWNEFGNMVELNVLATGTCGDNLIYTIYSDMTMVISGTGAMYDYSSSTHINNDYYQTIEKVIIEDGVTSIGDFAFSDCTGLTSVTIPNSVTSIGEYAFRFCEFLTSVDIPNSVTSIGESAFYRCAGLTSIDIPNSVTSIGEDTFMGCFSLAFVNIPNSVTSIGSYAFYGCTDLNSITVEWTTPLAIVSDVFENVDKSNCTLYVPVGTKTAYENAQYWNEFGNIVDLNVLATGTCGDNLIYTIYSDMTMVISGTGAMYDYSSSTHINNDYYQTIEKVIIEEGVTSIGERAFQRSTGLTSVTIPNSVTSIGDGAFFVCTGLTSIEIPSSVTSIGVDAFCHCYSLTSVVIPNSVTSIGEGAFFSCTGLTSIDISNSVTSIGRDAFAGCTGLTSVNIPNSVTSIGYQAFNGCTALTTVTIPSSVTNIGDDVFSGCTGLISIYVDANNATYDSRENCNAIIETSTNTLILGCMNSVIPNSVTSIDVHAFAGCTGLTSVNIPSSVTSIGYLAFGGCTGLNSITVEWTTPLAFDFPIFRGVDKSNCKLIVPVGTKTAYENAQGWNEFENIVEPDVLATGTCGDNLIYTIYSDMTMVISGTGAMYDYSSSTHINNDYYQTIEKVIIEEGVTSIGEYAFINCKGLTSIEIPNSVTSIGAKAFYYCTGLTSVVIPNSVTSIGDGAFLFCTGLTSIEIPSSVTSIGADAFNRCSSLTSVVIPNSVTSIGDGAFCYCSSLTSVVIPNSVTSIGDGAFFGCTGLTSIDISNSVTSIGQDAFSGCTGLTSVNIPNSVTSIGDWAFEDCTNLTSVNIPSSVTSIGEDAFLDCTGLISIYVDANNATYDSRENCNAIIETSTNTLILGCMNSVIPNSVTSIDGYAFAGCYGLTSVNIPSSVTSIGYFAFSRCTGLNSITVEWTTPLAIDNSIFGGVDKSNCKLIVPVGTKTAYENAQYWNEFETIEEIENVEDPDTDLSVYDNVVYIEGAEAFVGQQIRLSLKMNNTIEATGFQCDVYLPDGVTAAQDEDGFYLMDISEERTTSKKTDYVSSVLQPDGGLRFMCSSTRSYTFSGNEGEVAYLMVDIDPSMEGGSYPLILKNIEISDANSNPYRVSYVKTTLTIHPYTLGDANNDGSIGVSDFTAIANYIMGMPPASFLEIAADVNADDVISVSDLTGVANIILYGTVSPNASHAKARNDVAGKYANIGAKYVVATTDKEFTVAVNIDGNYAYSGYQFDMTLPEGMTVKNVEGQTKASDVFMSGMIDDNTLRVLCASTMGETTESTVVNLTLVADVEGTYSIDIDNAIVSANASAHPLSRSSFLVGIGSDATGISTLGDESGSNAAVYDLTGKKLIGNGNMSSLQKGIYIVNGKKVTK